MSFNLLNVASTQSTISYILSEGGNGLGSTATRIRVINNTTVNQGSDITLVTNTTDGNSYTINTDGLYAVHYTDQSSGGGVTQHGVSINASSLTDQIGLLPESEKLCLAGRESAANAILHAGTIAFLSAGDVLRPHVGGTSLPNAGANISVRFYIVRIY